MTGIYFIVNTITKKFYIGSTRDYELRKRTHINTLNINKHHSYRLQRAWNKSGADAFEFKLVQECTIEELIHKEQEWLDLLHPEYNILTNSGGGRKGKHSEESIAKMRKIKQENSGKIVYQFSLDGELIQKFNSISEAARSIGKKTNAHICSCCKGKRAYAYRYLWSYTPEIVIKKFKCIIIDQYDLVGNFIKEWKSLKQIARSFDINYHTVRDYIKGKTKITKSNLKKYKWKVR